MALNPQGVNVLHCDGAVFCASEEECHAALAEALKPVDPWLGDWQALCDDMKPRYAHTYEVKH